MKKILKTLSLLSFTALMLGGISSCKHDGDDIDNTVKVELDKNYKCDLSILIPSGNENEQTSIDELITVFNDKYPNINVTKKYVSVNSYVSTVRNQLAAGTLPDIVWSNSPDFYELVGMNASVDLTDWIKAANDAGHFNFENDFHTEFFNMGSLKGRYYCIPRSCDSVITFYNKELLKEAGIDTTAIKNGWTWEDFENIMAQYRKYLDTNIKYSSKKDTYYCLDANMTSWLYTCYPIMRSFQADVFDENTNVILESENNKEAMKFIRSLAEKKYIPYSGASIGSSFDSGTSPFLFQSASISLMENKAALKGKIDVVSFPLINNKNTPKIGAGIAGYCINQRSKEKAAAWQFIETLMSKDGQNAMGRGGIKIPSIRKDLDKADAKPEWMKGYEKYNMEAYSYGADYKITTEFLGTIDTRAKSGVEEAIKGMVDLSLREDKTIEDGIDAAVKSIKNTLKRFN